MIPQVIVYYAYMGHCPKNGKKIGRCDEKKNKAREIKNGESFLDVSPHLYSSVPPSVCPSVHRKDARNGDLQVLSHELKKTITTMQQNKGF